MAALAGRLRHRPDHAPTFVAELARCDQEPAYLGPEDYGRALRAAYGHERQVVDRLGLARIGE